MALPWFGTVQLGVYQICDESTLLPLRGGVNFTGDLVSASDNAAEGWTDVEISAGLIGGARQPVRATAHANIADLSDVDVAADFDTVTVEKDDRVLVPLQTDKTENGVYIVGTVTSGKAALTRAPDFAVAAHMIAGAQYYSQEGSTYEKSWWRFVTTGTIVVGTTELEFEQITWPIPDNPGDNQKTAYAKDGTVVYADNLKVIDDSGTERGFETVAGALKLKGGGGQVEIDTALAEIRAQFSATAGKGLEIYKPGVLTEWSALDYDRLAFAADANVAIGYTTTSSDDGHQLDINGQKGADGKHGGPVYVKTGDHGTGSSLYPGAYVVALGGSAEVLKAGEDANGTYVGMGVGTRATAGVLRLLKEFEIASYESGTPSKVRVLERDASGNLWLGYSYGGGPTIGEVHVCSNSGLYVHQAASDVYALLQPGLLTFVTDSAVTITRSTHSSGAGSLTTWKGQDAAGTDKAGGDLRADTGDPAGTANPGKFQVYTGGISTFAAYRWVGATPGAGFGVQHSTTAGLWFELYEGTKFQIYCGVHPSGDGLPLYLIGQPGASGAFDGGDVIVRGGADGGSGTDGGVQLQDGAGTKVAEVASGGKFAAFGAAPITRPTVNGLLSPSTVAELNTVVDNLINALDATSGLGWVADGRT